MTPGIDMTGTADAPDQGKPDQGKPLVGIVMGSRSDWETMQHAALRLEALGVRIDADHARERVGVRVVLGGHELDELLDDVREDPALDLVGAQHDAAAEPSSETVHRHVSRPSAGWPRGRRSASP